MIEDWSIQKTGFLIVVMGVITIMCFYNASYGYFALTATTFIRPQDDRPILNQLHIPLVMIIITLVGVLFQISNNKLKTKNNLSILSFKVYLAFLAMLIITSFMAYNPGVAWGGVEDFKFITAFFVFTLLLVRNEKEFRRLIYIVLFCGLYFAYLLQFKGSDMMESISDIAYARRNFMRLNINFGNPNYLAITMVIMFVFAFNQFLCNSKFWLKAIFFALCPIYIYTIIATMSRGGSLSLLAAVISLALFSKRKGLSISIVLFVLVVSVIFIPIYFPNYVERLNSISSYQEDASSTHRLALWSEGFGFMASSPLFGIGLNNFQELTYNSAHNSYIQMAAEIGIPGFLIWLFLLYLGWSYSRKSRIIFGKDINRNRNLYFISRSIEISLLACAVQSMFTGMGHREILFLLIAMGSGAYIISKKSVNIEKRIPGKDSFQEI